MFRWVNRLNSSLLYVNECNMGCCIAYTAIIFVVTKMRSKVHVFLKIDYSRDVVTK